MARSKKMPIAAILVAIGNLILFAPCFCCSGFGLAFGSAVGDGSVFAVNQQQKEEIKRQQAQLDREVPNMKTIGLIFNAANVLGSMVMVAAAIGLLMKQSWGRMLCILGAALMILITLGNTIYQATSVLPVTLRLQEQQMRQQNPGAAPPKGFFQGVGYGTLIFMTLFLAGYPLIALILMMTGPVRDFYSGGARDRSHEDELEAGWGDEPDRGRRRDDYDDLDR